MAEKLTLVCNKCNLKLTSISATFTYLDRVHHEDVLRCPNCGQVYLPETFIRGKLRLVEARMEDDFRTLNN